MADFHSHLTENSILATSTTNQMSSSMQRNTLQPTHFSPIMCQDDHVYYQLLHDHEISLQSLLLQHEAASILYPDNELPPIMAQELESNNGDPDNLVVVPLEEKKQKTDYKDSYLQIAREGKKNRKKRRDDLMKKVKEKKMKEDKMKDETKGAQGPQSEYIHVRARRGQATDSHSLAERVRREKISERMKLLQSLVPGCDKITGKTQVLDEIINYVQSLQNQVEVMMEKLEALNNSLFKPSLLQIISSENQMAHFPYPYHQEEQNNHGLVSLLYQDNGIIPIWDTIDQHQLHNSIRF